MGTLEISPAALTKLVPPMKANNGWLLIFNLEFFLTD